MAERLHRSAEAPDFETNAGMPLQAEVEGHDGNTALEEKARQFGSALGRAVVTLREAREMVKDIAGETREVAALRANNLKNNARETGARITGMAGDVAGTVRDKTRQWGEAASAAAEEWRQAAAERVQDIRSQARTGYYRARLRANQVVREYPLHVVLTAGVVGFLLGVGIRIWRSNRES